MQARRNRQLGSVRHGSDEMRSASLLATFLALGMPSLASAAEIVVHRDPGCGCCEQWAAQVRQQFGRRVTIVDDQRRTAFREAQGVPPHLVSCHTAIVDGMVFEGHVPISDMKRALAQRSRGVKGLAVAGMPIGAPGMEVPGQRAQSFNVVAFGSSGQKIFARYGGQ
ncbi:protein of unknown function DUF411 [Sphingopyxis alaskensis RB2256]|uniref:Metal-binding protein n=2 Tax=Sphingopyxis alaskensis TaxID=117207 RepID=Q1GQ21_SPHAL|nr:protein of unknown function DUF411 [Sphingopyxis alaskensis RB2256]